MCRMTELESLTHNMAMIQPSFTSSKWNMGENFGLKMIVKSGLEKISLCRSHFFLINFTSYM